jgi:hypothetical protein
MNAHVVPLKPVSAVKQEDVLIHVRFHPNSDIWMIDKRPDHLSPKDWMARLWSAFPDYYLGLSGGRGFFRIPQDKFAAILSRT